MSHYDFVGVDVAKDKFDVAIYIRGFYQQLIFSNCPKGHKEFHEWLIQHTLEPWVCMEATSHYSVTLADFLVKNAIRVSVVNPFQVKNFARASLAAK